MRWQVLAFCVLPVSAYAQNATVDELVGESVFGVKWTDSIEAVKARYPSGERSKIGQTQYWTVTDNRTIFDVERGKRDTIQFGFLGSALGGVSVSFPNCIAATTALSKFLGPSDAATNHDSFAAALSGLPSPVNTGKWTGAKATVSAYGIGRDCIVSIAPLNTAPAEAARGRLGLE